MDLTPSFSEKSAVTLSESLSSAGAASRISVFSGSASPSAASTSAADVAVAFLSRYVSRLPLYSGSRSISPFLRAGM